MLTDINNASFFFLKKKYTNQRWQGNKQDFTHTALILSPILQLLLQNSLILLQAHILDLTVHSADTQFRSYCRLYVAYHPAQIVETRPWPLPPLATLDETMNCLEAGNKPKAPAYSNRLGMILHLWKTCYSHPTMPGKHRMILLLSSTQLQSNGNQQQHNPSKVEQLQSAILGEKGSSKQEDL